VFKNTGSNCRCIYYCNPLLFFLFHLPLHKKWCSQFKKGCYCWKIHKESQVIKPSGRNLNINTVQKHSPWVSFPFEHPALKWILKEQWGTVFEQFFSINLWRWYYIINMCIFILSIACRMLLNCLRNYVSKDKSSFAMRYRVRQSWLEASFAFINIHEIWLCLHNYVTCLFIVISSQVLFTMEVYYTESSMHNSWLQFTTLLEFSHTYDRFSSYSQYFYCILASALVR
jgi:hypothetical protein